MVISNPMTVVGLVNAMIGGIILVMPLLALKTGWLLIQPITIFSGFVSYLSCLLCLRHLRNYKSLDVAIYYHFGKKTQYKIFYDIIIIVSQTALLTLYFSLICEQWSGIIGQSKIISILNALVLFPLVYIMKKYDFGASLLAYGIISVVGYLIFLFWLYFSSEPGPNTLPATDRNFVGLAAALAQGFAIQTIFIPILKKNPNPKLYKKLLALTYIVGTLIYTYIGYIGAYSIINRTANKEAQTIEDYFGNGQSWQVIVVQIIYLIHLYSAFPEFLLIAKQRFFSMMKWPEPSDISVKQVIYVAATIFLSLVIKLTNTSIMLIIQLNGSIVSFFFIYVIPIGLHMKCVYFTKPEDRHSILNQQKQRQIEEDTGQKQQYKKQTQDKQYIGAYSSQGQRQKQQIQMQQVQFQKSIQKKQQNKDQIKTDNESITKKNEQILTEESNKQNFAAQQQQSPNQVICECDIKFKSKWHQYAQLSFLCIMFTTGILIMVYTLYTLFNEQR